MSTEDIKIGDRVRFLKNFGPGYGAEGTVVEIRETSGSDRWRVNFDKWDNSRHDDGRDGWWCHSIEKMPGSQLTLAEKVMSYLAHPHRSARSKIVRDLEAMSFFSVSAKSQLEMLNSYIYSDAVCEEGRKRFLGWAATQAIYLPGVVVTVTTANGDTQKRVISENDISLPLDELFGGLLK